MASAEITTHRVRGVQLVRLKGEMELAMAARLQSALDQAVRPGGRVLLDMVGVTLLDSAAIREILRLYSGLSEVGGRLALAVRPASAVKRVVLLCGLHQFLPVHESVRDALCALRRDETRWPPATRLQPSPTRP
jgi:anti-sigma B factor antagonist